MRRFEDYNPVAAAVYFLAAAGIGMFSMAPVMLLLSLCGALLCQGLLGEGGKWRVHLYTLALFVGMMLINPLISHNGVTVLFVMNHNPVTLEALLYGAAAAGMIVSVMYWFRSFTLVMTSDKLLYIFGTLSPKLALMLSMALRYVPLFTQQAAKVSRSQKALGLYREDNLIDRMKGGMRVFSVMVTWTLENGIITADSMAGRGYGVGRRSRYAIFRWTRNDWLLLLSTLLLAALTLWGTAAQHFAYYPAITSSPLTARGLTGYAAYGLLTLLPAIITGKEAIQWRILQSKI